MAKPNGGIVGQSIIPGTGQLFGVYSATTAAELTGAGLYSVTTGNIATKVLAPADPVITDIVYTDSTFANIVGAVATTANTTGNIRIFGTNFVSGSTVYIANQASAYTNVVNTNEVQARVPSLTAGTYSNIMIFSPAGSGILSNLAITTVTAPLFTSSSTLSFTSNTAFSTTITAIGVKAVDGYRISAGSLPGNVSFNTTTGALSGNVTVNSFSATAAWNFDVTASTDLGVTTVQNCYLIINGNIGVTYLVVAGGGRGGATTASGPFGSLQVGEGGSGGAGGYLTGNIIMDTAQTYTMIQGGGSTSGLVAGGNSSIVSPWPVFSPIVAFGGGYGGESGYIQSPGSPRFGGSGGPGGSGGGGGTPNGSQGAGTPGQGYPGIASVPSSIGGKGGGATAPGAGAPNLITGANIVYAAGGTPAPPSTPSVSGYGNGGAGAVSQLSIGGGMPGNPGIVIVRYSSPSQLATGGTVTNYNSGPDKFWVHQFTSPGTFLVGSSAGFPIWANANVAFYANYYNTAISTQLRAYNAASYAVASGNTLPGGLTVSTSGLLSGTAATESTSFYINATSSTSLVSSQEFSLTYTYPTPVWVTAATLPAGNTAVAYSQQLSATVNNLGSVVYSVSAGNTVPDGLTLTSSGLLSGSFTTTSNVSYSFYVRAEHNIGSNYYSERQFTMNVTYVYPVTLLVVAGGGAGGGYHPTSPSSGTGMRGGGGAGGYREFGNLFIRDIKYTVTVGAAGVSAPIGTGGSGGPSSIIGGTVGTLGYNTLTSTGGGGGGSNGTPTVNGTNGGPGGSGGGHGASIVAGASGGTGQQPVAQPSPLAPIQNQGYPGSPSSGTTAGQGGGGGGAAGLGQPGQPPTGTSQVGIAGTFFGPFGTGQGGGGGRGRYSTITGANVMYAAGANSVSTGQSIGATNTGNGGAGVVPANGGSGVVILSVPTGSYTANFSPAPVVTVTNNGPQTVMTFTQSGTYTS